MIARTPEIAVADTHALIWWFGGMIDRLGRRARQFFSAVEQGRAVVCIPTLALAELSESVQTGRGRLTIPFPAFVAELEQTPSRYQIIPLTTDIVLRAHDLYAIPERGDRLIAATAAELGYPLLTRDRAIAAAGAVDVLW